LIMNTRDRPSYSIRSIVVPTHWNSSGETVTDTTTSIDRRGPSAVLDYRLAALLGLGAAISFAATELRKRKSACQNRLGAPRGGDRRDLLTDKLRAYGGVPKC
jgi:hypothetical protein